MKKLLFIALLLVTLSLNAGQVIDGTKLFRLGVVNKSANGAASFNYDSFVEFQIFEYETADLSDLFNTGGNIRYSWKFDVASGNVTAEQGVKVLTASGTPTYSVDNIPDWYSAYSASVMTDANGEGFSDSASNDYDLTPPYTMAMLTRYPRSVAGSSLVMVAPNGSNLSQHRLANTTQFHYSVSNAGAYTDLTFDSAPFHGSFHLAVVGVNSSGNMYAYYDETSNSNSETKTSTIDDPAIYISEESVFGEQCVNCEYVAFAIIDQDPSTVDMNKAYPKTIDSSTTDDFLTFARTTKGTGIIQASGTDQMQDYLIGNGRKEYKDSAWSVKIEGESENLCLQSEDFSTTWSVTTGNASVTTNQDSFLLGRENWADDLVDDNASASEYIEQDITVAAATEYTFSVYVKKDVACTTNDTVTLYLDGTTADCTATTSWTRCSVTDASSSGTSIEARIYPCDSTDNDTGTIAVAGGQLNLGDFPTSYVYTTTASVKQEDEEYQLTSYASKGVDLDYLAMCYWVNFDDPTLDDYNALLQADSTDNFRMYAADNNGFPNIQSNGLADNFNSTCGTCTPTSNEWNRFCLFTNQADGKFYWIEGDGTSITETDTDSFTANGSYAADLKFGLIGSNYRQLNGTIAAMHFYTSNDSDPLTTNEMIDIATQHYTDTCTEYSFDTCP